MDILYFSIDNCESLSEISDLYGDKLMISGNIPPVDVFRDGSIDDVIEAVDKCISEAYKNPKGFVIDAGCQVPLGTPYENVEAYIYEIRRKSQELFGDQVRILAED